MTKDEKITVFSLRLCNCILFFALILYLFKMPGNNNPSVIIREEHDTIYIYDTVTNEKLIYKEIVKYDTIENRNLESHN